MTKAPQHSFRKLQAEALEKRLCLATTVENVLNLNTHNLWQDIREITPSGNHVYFVASTPGLQDLELWRMGANQSSAVRLTTLGPDDRKPRGLTDVNGTLFFKGYAASTKVMATVPIRATSMLSEANYTSPQMVESGPVMEPQPERFS